MTAEPSGRTARRRGRRSLTTASRYTSSCLIPATKPPWAMTSCRWFRILRSCRTTIKFFPVSTVLTFWSWFAHRHTVVFHYHILDYRNDPMCTYRAPPTKVLYNIINTLHAGMTYAIESITSKRTTCSESFAFTHVDRIGGNPEMISPSIVPCLHGPRTGWSR